VILMVRSALFARVSNHEGNRPHPSRRGEAPLLRMRVSSVYSVQPPSIIWATPVVNALSSLAR
jgi:hypothetical protein